MTNPPFMHEKGQPRLWMRDLTPEEVKWISEEKQRLADAYRKLQTETERGN